VSGLGSRVRAATASRLPGRRPDGARGSGTGDGDAGSAAVSSSRCHGDAGSAVVEFCLLGVLLLVPIVYLVLALGRIQAGAFAAQGAAREAGRAFVTAADEGSARGRADAAAAIAFADQGFSAPSRVGIEVACAASPCLAPDQRVVVRSRVLVVLPGVPSLIDRFFPARVEVTARHVATVDRFRSRSALQSR